MKIGYFIGHFPYPNLVNLQNILRSMHMGVQKYSYNLAPNMAKRGHMIDIITTSMDS